MVTPRLKGTLRCVEVLYISLVKSRQHHTTILLSALCSLHATSSLTPESVALVAFMYIFQDIKNPDRQCTSSSISPMLGGDACYDSIVACLDFTARCAECFIFPNQFDH